MPERDDVLDVLAGLVDDGQAVDWDATLAAAGERERRWIANLRVLSEVRRVARSGGVDAPASAPSVDITLDAPAARAVAEAFAAESATPAAAAVPAMWGTLQLLEHLGGGGFGDVYRAWDRRLHRQVALKLSRGDAPVLDEARLLARAEHPHIVRIYGVDTHDGRTGIWMELVQGVSLHDLVAERGPLPPADAVRIGIDLCSALGAVHAANVVHQDVKPQNVMREAATGRVLLMDFGAGRSRDAAGRSRPLAGTPRFLAPEIFTGAAPSPQSDVYGLGALLFFLLCGRPPVDDGSAAEIQRRHAAQQLASLTKLRPGLHPALVAAVERALDPDRARRFASAAEFGAALEAARIEMEPAGVRDSQPAAAADTGRPAQPSQPAPSAPASEPQDVHPQAPGTQPAAPRRRRRVALIGVMAAMAALAVMAVVLAGRRPWFGPPALTARVQFLEATNGRTLALDDPIGTNDRLEIAIEASQPAYVYVLNVDPATNTTVMFPMAGGATPNPLAGGRVHTLPGSDAGARLGWTFGGGAGTERFLVVASAERLAEFEDALASLPAVALGGGLTAKPVGEETVALLTRGVTGVARLPQPQAPAAGAQSLFDLAHRLAADPQAKSRVWIQEMRLVNRGR